MKAKIRTLGDLLAFRSDVRREYQGTALEGDALECVLLALTELGTNLIRHAEAGGTLECTVHRDDGVFRIAANNAIRTGDAVGSGLPGGLGIGLDSLNRLMDQVRIRTHEGGLDIVSEKRLPPGAREVQ